MNQSNAEKWISLKTKCYHLSFLYDEAFQEYEILKCVFYIFQNIYTNLLVNNIALL